MKLILTSLAVAIATTLFFAAVRHASATSCTTSRVGDYAYTNCSNGYRSTSSRVGDYTYTNDNRGHRCTKSQVGDYTYTNCN